ncbi:MAG TPA: hypothetical protein VK335_16460 [Bryobacteraceae bacterium]|nr:hypothetical protein [Bryobacteraceae bacterium]
MDPFYVESDPAPDGALEAFHEGRTLCDATGLGYLHRFLSKANLLDEADIQKSDRQNREADDLKKVICATKKHVR